MGYTHYYPSGKFDFSKEFLDDVKKIIETAEERGIALVSDHRDQESEPVVSSDEIYFNGGDGLDCETFHLQSASGLKREYEGLEIPDYEFEQFTKTNERPYDAVAVAILLRMNEEDPTLKIGSDGTFFQDWQEGSKLFSDALGRDAMCPDGVKLATVSFMQKDDFPSEFLSIGNKGISKIWGNDSGYILSADTMDLLKDSGADVYGICRTFQEKCGAELQDVLDVSASGSLSATRDNMVFDEHNLDLSYVTDINGVFYSDDMKCPESLAVRDNAPSIDLAYTQIVKIDGEYRVALEFEGYGDYGKSQSRALRIAEELLDKIPDCAPRSLVSFCDVEMIDKGFATVILPAGLNADEAQDMASAVEMTLYRNGLNFDIAFHPSVTWERSEEHVESLDEMMSAKEVEVEIGGDGIGERDTSYERDARVD